LYQASDLKSENKEEEEMQQRKSALGRPSGTDGSDYSYRMVVDSSKYFHSPIPFFSLKC